MIQGKSNYPQLANSTIDTNKEKTIVKSLFCHFYTILQKRCKFRKLVCMDSVIKKQAVFIFTVNNDYRKMRMITEQKMNRQREAYCITKKEK